MEMLNATPTETIIGTLIVLGGAFFFTYFIEEPLKRFFRTILQRIRTK